MLMWRHSWQGKGLEVGEAEGNVSPPLAHRQLESRNKSEERWVTYLHRGPRDRSETPEGAHGGPCSPRLRDGSTSPRPGQGGVSAAQAPVSALLGTCPTEQALCPAAPGKECCLMSASGGLT